MKREDLRIKSPCTANWDTMTASGRKRFCADCKKHVHDLSSMPVSDARALLATRPAEGLCIRYLHDEFGAVIFNQVDASLVPVTRLERAKTAFERGAITATCIAAGTAIAACAGATPDGAAPEVATVTLLAAGHPASPMTAAIPSVASANVPVAPAQTQAVAAATASAAPAQSSPPNPHHKVPSSIAGKPTVPRPARTTEWLGEYEP